MASKKLTPSFEINLDEHKQMEQGRKMTDYHIMEAELNQSRENERIAAHNDLLKRSKLAGEKK